jgi:hypothetical protein
MRKYSSHKRARMHAWLTILVAATMAVALGDGRDEDSRTVVAPAAGRVARTPAPVVTGVIAVLPRHSIRRQHILLAGW